MNSLLIHKTARQALNNFVQSPSHALLLIAPSGSGKGAIAKMLASELLEIDELRLQNHPYYKLVHPDEHQIISIDTIRNTIHFTTLKTTSKTGINRVIIIEDSHKMTLEAQNALLKTVEEPPKGTTLILTTSNERLLIPTILSRLQVINIPLPNKKLITEYFIKNGYDTKAVEHALLMSDGLIGLMQALLSNTDHPLIEATIYAHDLLRKTPFERITIIDELAKDKQYCQNVIFILEQMATLTLYQSNKNFISLKRWQKILKACHAANKQLLANSQIKLVLLNFMLSL